MLSINCISEIWWSSLAYDNIWSFDVYSWLLPRLSGPKCVSWYTWILLWWHPRIWLIAIWNAGVCSFHKYYTMLALIMSLNILETTSAVTIVISFTKYGKYMWTNIVVLILSYYYNPIRSVGLNIGNGLIPIIHNIYIWSCYANRATI